MPSGSNLIVTGPAGVGKSGFCNNLLRESLEKGVNVIYVALDASPKYIKQRVLEQCQKCSFEAFTFIDGYSWLLKKGNERYQVSHLNNLSELSVKIFDAENECKERPFILFFDSISTLFIYNSENEITRFLQVNMARIKESNSLGLWTVEEGIHQPAFYNSLRHIADGVIEMRFEEDRELRRFIRVHTLKGLTHKTNWLQFIVRNKGEFTMNPFIRSKEQSSLTITQE